MAINLGGMVRLTYAVRNAAGVLTDPSTRVLTITQPDGTVLTPTVAAPTTTGQLVHDFTPTQAGLHSVAWSTTGPTTADTDVFTVEPPAVQLVSVDEAVAHLRAAGTITSDRDREQLQWLCMVATDAVERDLDRYLVRRTVTATGSTSSPLWLRGPVLSVTSVSVNGGAALDPAGYSLAGGLLSPTYRWGGLTGTVAVTYVAGYPNPPRVARLAVLNLVQSLWQQTQQAPQPFVDESSADAFVSSALPGLTQIPGYDALRVYAVA